VALYGLDHMPEAAFGRQLSGRHLTVLHPESWLDCMHICALHQRRSRRAEWTVPSVFDLVLWGHEHACEIAGGMDQVADTDTQFCVIQPGSTVHVRGPAGKLGSGQGSGRLHRGQRGKVAHEHATKHVAMVKVRNDSWKLQQLPLTTVRPAEYSPPTPLDRMRNEPKIMHMITMARQNPALIQPLLEELGRTDPGLVKMVQENQADFMALLNGSAPLPAGGAAAPAPPAAPAQGGGAPPGQVQIRLTPEEGEAVQRLMGMGFSEEDALQAFMACDKDESLAANLLLDNM